MKTWLVDSIWHKSKCPSESQRNSYLILSIDNLDWSSLKFFTWLFTCGFLRIASPPKCLSCYRSAYRMVMKWTNILNCGIVSKMSFIVSKMSFCKEYQITFFNWFKKNWVSSLIQPPCVHPSNIPETHSECGAHLLFL